MNLSSIITGVPEYIEFGWVTAPNAAGQNISANTITTLTLNTEVADTGNLVSAPTSNQFTLPSGTYYFEASVQTYGAGALQFGVFSFYNVSDSQYVTKTPLCSYYTASGGSYGANANINGQIVISASKQFELRILSEGAATVGSGFYTSTLSNTISGADQRTTIKLWKLK